MPMRIPWIAVIVTGLVASGGVRAADPSQRAVSINFVEPIPTPVPTAEPTPIPSEGEDSRIGQLAQQVPSFDTGEDCEPPGRGKAGFIAYAEFLHWQPHALSTDFATVVDPATLTPGYTESLGMDRTNGFRVGLGYRFTDTCCDFTWNFTSYHGHGETTLGSNGGTVGLLAPHSVYATMPMDSIEAVDTLQLNVHDFELNWRFPLNETVGFRALAAFRWATLDEDFVNNYTYLINATGSVHMPIKMDAGGLRLGAEVQWQSPWGFQLFGRGAESILVGSFRSRRQESDSLHGPLADVLETSTKIVPVVEAALGARWTRGPLAIDAGYELSDWFNLAGTVPVQPAAVPGKAVVPLVSQPQSLFLEGCFVRLTYTR